MTSRLCCSHDRSADSHAFSESAPSPVEKHLPDFQRYLHRLPSAGGGTKLFFRTLLSTAMLSVLISNPAVAQSTDAAQAAAQETRLDQEDRAYTVQPGDTLRGIARRQYGSIGFWRMLAEHNGLDGTESLRPGDSLSMPIYVESIVEYAEVIYVKGEVNLIRPEEKTRKLTRDDRIYINDQIQTGKFGFASILFASGTMVNIQPASLVELVGLSCLATAPTCFVSLDAEAGSMNSSVESGAKLPDGSEQKSEFLIHTPYATAAVRGTVIDFEASPDQLLVGVTEGVVDIVANNTTTELPTGFGAIGAPGAATSEPIPLPVAPTFRGIPPRFADGDKISWWGLRGSTGYIVRLGTDQTSRSALQRQRDLSNVFTIDGVRPGEYFLSVRGVDENGLKGFGNTQKINVVAIDDGHDGIEIETTRQGNDLLVEVTDPDLENVPGYEIQLSATPEFDDVVSVDIGASGEAIFRSPESLVYVRARALLDARRVSVFGAAVNSE